MPELYKHRILELIGDRKYHSVFMTTYAFDFVFFETTMMRQLKANHLININVLVDNNQLHGSLGFTTGSAKGISRGYSIAGIEGTGVFHPKLFIFIGNKEGAVIIGSGNITASGFGRNMEIWGAFHIDGPEDPKAGLFMQSWEYIKARIRSIPGFTNQRVLFAEANAPWLREIKPSAEFVILDNSERIAVLFNDKSKGIGEKLKDHIVDTIKRITIVSPFYDKKLDLIKKLQQQFNVKEIHLVMPTSGELLPEKVPDNLKNIISFSRWEDLFKEDYRRLHAKLLHLESNGGDEYLIFGSANATMAAFGFKQNFNEEVSIILRNPGGSILSNLGFPKRLPECKLSDFKRIEPEVGTGEFEKHYSFSINLVSIDQEGGSFFIYISTSKEYKNLTLILFDSFGDKIQECLLIEKKNHYEATIGGKVIFNGMFGQLFHKGIPVSNKQVIQDIYELSKGNPSPDLGQLDEHFSLINSGQEDLTVLLDFLVFDKEDDEIPIFSGRSASSDANEDQEEEKNQKDYKTLSYDEITQEDQNRFNLKYKYLHNSTSRILDFLLNYLYKFMLDENDLQLADEEESEDINKSTGRSDFLVSSPISTIQLEEGEFHRIAAKIKRHLSGYRDHLRELAIQSGKTEGKVFISLKEYSKFIIASQFLILYGGKYQGVRNVVKKYKSKYVFYEETEVNFKPFIPFSGDLGDFNFKSLAIDILGDFLWLLIRVDKNLLSDPTRFQSYQNYALINALLCISLIPWNEDYEKYKNLKEVLFLNTVEYIGDSNFNDIYEKEDLWTKLQILSQKAGQKDESSVKKIRKLFDEFQERYNQFKEEFNKELSGRKNIIDIRNLTYNDIIFRSQFGFCGIHKLKNAQIVGSGTILFRPGLHDQYDNDPMLSAPMPQSKLMRV